MIRSPEKVLQKVTKHLNQLEKEGDIDRPRKEKLMNYLQRLSPTAQGSIDSKEEKSNESLPRIVDTRKQFDSSISPGNLRLQ